MTEDFRRQFESALPLIFRLAMVATIIFALIACEYETDFGATRIATTAEGVAVETRVGGSADRIVIYESKDGGLTWQVASLGYGPRNFQWSVGGAVTPNGKYRTDGTEITRISNSNRVIETVYSAEDLRGHINNWVLGKGTEHLGRWDLSFEPSGIAYDEYSGNLMAPMGVQGVLVGTPAGPWSLVAVGPYAPADSSRLGRVRALFSASEFWGTLLTLPLTMLALSMLVARLRQDWPLDAAFILISLGFLALAIIISGLLLLLLAFPTTTGGSVFILAIFSVLSSAVSVCCSWQGRWLKLWRAILGSLLGMMAFVTISFVVWLQVGGSSGFAALAAILLCATTTWVIHRLLLRIGPQWTVTWSGR